MSEENEMSTLLSKQKVLPGILRALQSGDINAARYIMASFADEARDEIALLLNPPASEKLERRLAEACELMRRAAGTVAMGGEQGIALELDRRSRLLLGDISPWSERERTSQKANSCAHTADPLNLSQCKKCGARMPTQSEPV